VLTFNIETAAGVTEISTTISKSTHGLYTLAANGIIVNKGELERMERYEKQYASGKRQFRKSVIQALQGYSESVSGKTARYNKLQKL